MQGYVTVDTACGQLRGFEHAGVVEFLGVPYAEPPIGERRFKPAQPKEPWTGVRDAMTFGAVSLQLDTRLEAKTPERMAVMKLMYPKGGNPLEANAMSEDCLFLNVWTPDVTGQRPVMVWLHGGGFAQGSGSINLYQGDNLAALGDVVVVTLNHRLGITGFLSLSDADDDEYVGSANAGMTDVVEALRWIRANISAFGGDPNNVTVFGQSGGGVKVGCLMAMPSAYGYFHKAISMSGPGLRVGTPEAALRTRKRVFELAGVSSAAELRTFSSAQLLDVANRMGFLAGSILSLNPQPGAGGGMNLGPSIDASTIPWHPMDPEARPEMQQVPMIVGYTTHDPSFLFLDDPGWKTLDEAGIRHWLQFVYKDAADQWLERYPALPGEGAQLRFSRIVSHAMFGSGAVAIAERKSAQPASVYAYEFGYQANVFPGLLGASHSMDLAFAFHNTTRAPFSGTEDVRHEVSRNLALAFARFAHTGSPEHSGIPEWPTYNTSSRATMLFDRQCAIRTGTASAEMPALGLGL